MKTFYLQMILALFIGIGVSTLGTATIYAADYKWGGTSATHGYDDSYPSGEWRSRAMDARNTWNAVAPSPWTWSWLSSSSSKLYYTSICCGRLGETSYGWCGIPQISNICRMDLRVNSGAGYIWYTGTGTPPSNSYDLWGVLIHEFGHAAGLWNHSTKRCGANDEATLCPLLPQGNTRWRSLETDDDKNRLNSRYPG